MNDIDYIIPILKKYHTAFTNKTYPNIKTNKPDALMDIFGITTELQEKHKQYWGRELGMIWQLLVTEVCKHHCHSFKPAFRVEIYEPCDLIVGDTFYYIALDKCSFTKLPLVFEKVRHYCMSPRLPFALMARAC